MSSSPLALFQLHSQWLDCGHVADWSWHAISNHPAVVANGCVLSAHAVAWQRLSSLFSIVSCLLSSHMHDHVPPIGSHMGADLAAVPLCCCQVTYLAKRLSSLLLLPDARQMLMRLPQPLLQQLLSSEALEVEQVGISPGR